MKKILFATIVPFWNRATGAQQRIFSMVKVLMAHGHQVQVFFPGHAELSDRKTAEQLGLDVAFHCSDQPAVSEQSLSRTIKWQVDAVKHAVHKFAEQNFKGDRGEKDDEKNTLRLSDFRWPWAEIAFENAVIEFAPQVVVCEYITMAYLVESLPADLRSEILCMIDTHDLLSRRQQEFANHGQPHWISVSHEEEAAALRAFDTIVAIEQNEAHAFEEMAPGNAVIVVGHHALGTAAPDTQGLNDPESFTLGYLGSSNASNVDAVNNFLDVVWRDFQREPRIKLVLAGKVSDGVIPELRFANVEMLGHVSGVDDFYTRVDAVINPVGYGTGLKIKSVEAIAHGKPLLCTSAGWAGSPIGGVTAVDPLKAMTGVIRHWFKDSETFERVRLAACASEQRSADEIYRPLLELLG